MMSVDRRIELARRKERLIQRSAEQRATLMGVVRRLERPASAADRALDGVHFLGRHPVIVAAFAAGLVVMRPKSLWRWVTNGIVLWRSWRNVRAWLERIPA